MSMNQRQIIALAKSGRPDLAAINAGLYGRPRLAAYVARWPHSDGKRYTVRQLVTSALRAARCLRNGKDIWGSPEL